MQAFLLDLGHGFAFVGRQYRFEVDGEEFRIDLLFFNWLQSRFVVVELKTARFRPEFTGQLGFYVAWVDEQLRDQSRHAATVGILLCAGRNDRVVRYSLAGSALPLAVADYTYDALPAAVREVVPTANALLAAVAATPVGAGHGSFEAEEPSRSAVELPPSDALSAPAAQHSEPAPYAEAMRLDIAVLVTGLRELLGSELVAYLGGVQETRAVRQWADGLRGAQDPADERRLRLAYQVAGLLSVRDPAGVVQAWFQGLNPQLGDRAPARVLREDDLNTAGPLVLAAARSFAATG